MERNSDFVTSVSRGLAVIRAFGRDAETLTLSDVARRTGLTRASARRFLLTLQQLGYVQADGRSFKLTPRVLDLGYAYLSSVSLPEAAQPVLERLVEAVRESCSVTVLDGTEIVYVARVPTKRIMSVSLSIGTRLPAYATAMGRAILAYLPVEEQRRILAASDLRKLTPRTVTDPERLLEILARVRAQGYALVDQELEEGLRVVAVPIFNKRSQVIAAMNVSGHASRTSSRHLIEHVLPQLLEGSKSVTAALAD